MIPTVAVTRYVTPLREGGSLPGIVEADDLGTYVCKFRGAGQGVRVLVAEVIVGGLAAADRAAHPAAGRRSQLDPEIARYEADEEVQDLLKASAGLNLGVDFLPGSFGFDGTAPAGSTDPARVLWLDAFCANVDRSWRNPNLLLWHGDLWVIDHGASLYFHHGWSGGVSDPARFADQPWSPDDHVFEDRVAELPQVDDEVRGLLGPDVFAEVLADVPDEWLEPVPGAEDPEALRAAYVAFLTARLGTTPVAAVGRIGGGVNSYQYVVLRCVPRVDREEFVNVGVVLYCEAGRLPQGGLARRGRPAAVARPARRRTAGLRRPGLRRRRVRRRRARGRGGPAADSAPGSASSRPRAAPCSSPARCTAASPPTPPASSSACSTSWSADAESAFRRSSNAASLRYSRRSNADSAVTRDSSADSALQTGTSSTAPTAYRARMVRARSGWAPSGSETATAPASRASSAARSGRKPGARNSEATAMWRRPSARKARTASPVAGGALEAYAAVTGSLWCGAPEPGQPGHGLVGERVAGAGRGQHQGVELADPGRASAPRAAAGRAPRGTTARGRGSRVARICSLRVPGGRPRRPRSGRRRLAW